MFDFRYQWTYWRLNSKKNKIEKYFSNKIKIARLDRKQGDADMLIHQSIFETDEYDDEIGKLHSQHLIKEAGKFLLPIPEGDDAWEESRFDGRHYLSKKGRRELYVLIRAERKENWEFFKGWIAGLTGIIGATTGLIAILLKK